MKIISIIIPAYNEDKYIVQLLDNINSVDTDSIGFSKEIIVIDDGSTDQTLNFAQEAALIHSGITVIHQDNQGKGNAVQRGVREAKGEFILVQDADLEYDPQEYGLMIQPLLDGHADVVYGSRFISNRPHRVLYYWHSLGNRFLTTLSNMTSNLNLSDMETCYKAFRLEVLRSFTLSENRFGIEPELTARVSAGKWRVYEVGISYHGRSYEDGKKIGWKDGISAIRSILKYAFIAKRDLRKATDG